MYARINRDGIHSLYWLCKYLDHYVLGDCNTGSEFGIILCVAMRKLLCAHMKLYTRRIQVLYLCRSRRKWGNIRVREVFAQEKKCTDSAKNFLTYLQFLAATLFSSAKEICVAWGKIEYLY